MCGIVGIIGKSPVTDRILGSLKRLEYRGYDSAGIAVVNDNHGLQYRKVVGKIAALDSKLKEEPVSGNIGIGHTRWATHGEPAVRNAHPMIVDGIAVVHNGIIENHTTLRRALIKEGYKFESETDTEVVPNLIASFLKRGLTPKQAAIETLKKLEGAFAITIMIASEDNLLIGLKRGAPLAIGIGDGEMYLGSDALALSPFTNKIIYLDDNEFTEITKTSHAVYNKDGDEVKKSIKNIDSCTANVCKEEYEHYMLKEIYEQPRVVSDILAHYHDKESKLDLDSIQWGKYDRIQLIGCGTSYNAACIAKYWLEHFTRLPIDIDIASEFRYRHVAYCKKTLAIFISQSGETADTLAALKHCSQHGLDTLAIVNVMESSMAHAADFKLPLLAGYEIGVASTKAFTAQLLVLALVAIDAAKKLGTMDKETFGKLNFDLSTLSDTVAKTLELNDEVKRIAEMIMDSNSIIYVGRGTCAALANEGALKMKELSYIHAEGMPAGELKHGSIALIDPKMPVIASAPSDHLFGKMESNIQEIFARSGRMVVITDEDGVKEIKHMTRKLLIVPKGDYITNPIIHGVVMQLLSYHVANSLGKDVDQPRNLAKSVTVE